MNLSELNLQISHEQYVGHNQDRSAYRVGGITWSASVSTEMIASAEPEAPRRWPIIDLLELMGNDEAY